MNPLQQVANLYVAKGWTITSMNEEQFAASRKAPLGLLFWIGVVVGLFVFVVPGLFFLILGLAFRKTENVVVTKAQAERELGIR
jgi:hypothetical protein